MAIRILCLRPIGRLDERPARNRSGARSAAFMLDDAERARWADEVEEFSPLIGWVAGLSSPCLCLDVGPTAHGFGGERGLLDRLRDWAARRGLACVAALADTLGAAWGVAHFALGSEAAGNKFHAWRDKIVRSGGEASALASLDVAALRLSPDLTSLLRELGIEIVEPLWTLPREALAERFSSELLLRMDQALGRVPELFVAHRPPPTYETQLGWEEGVVDAASIAAVGRRLLPQLLTPLRRRGRGVTRLLAELSGEFHSLDRFVIGLLRPTLDLEHLLGLLQLRLESFRVRQPIVAVRFAVLEEAALPIQQQVLFSDLAPPAESHAWTSLVERLAGRLGNDAVVRVRILSDHQPERAWRPVPWLKESRKAVQRKPPPPRKSRSPAEDVFPAKLPRPTLLLPRPAPIRVFSVAPQGYPRTFENRGAEHRVVKSWGPERIETGWWRGPSVRRDYFRVATSEGIRCWLFRDLRSGRWFLHGWFD